MKVLSLFIVCLISQSAFAGNWWSVNDLSRPSLVFFYNSGDRTNAGRSQNFRIGGLEFINQDRVRVVSGTFQSSQDYTLNELRTALYDQLKQIWFFQIIHKEAIYSILEWLDLVESHNGKMEQRLVTGWFDSWETLKTAHIETVISFYSLKAPNTVIANLLEVDKRNATQNNTHCADLF